MTTQLQYGMGGERPYSLYYQHSGKTPIIAIILAGVAGVAAGIVLAFIYAYVDAWCPYAKGRALAAVIFGLGVGAATAAIAKAGKVRSLAVVLALVATATFVAYYFSWIFWIDAALSRFINPSNASRMPTLSQLTFNPAHLLRLIHFFNANGYWSMTSSGNDAATGIGLTLIWIAEAACIFGTAFTVAYGMTRSSMFCEACNRWCNKMITLRNIPAAPDVPQARQALEAHDFTCLQPSGNVDASNFWSLDYEHCNFCNKLHAITIRAHKRTIDKKGRIKAQKVKTLVDRLLVDPEEIKAIRYPSPPAPVPVAAPAVPPPPPLPGAAPNQ